MKIREQLRIFMVLTIFIFFSVEMFSQTKDVIPPKSVVHTMNDNALQWGPCPDFLPEGCEIAVLHGDPAKRNVDIFFKVPANSQIANHAHTSAERMVLVSGEMEITYEGEETQKLKTGSYAYGPAEKPHTARCGNSGPCVLFIAFEEPLDAYAVEK